MIGHNKTSGLISPGKVEMAQPPSLGYGGPRGARRKVQGKSIYTDENNYMSTE